MLAVHRLSRPFVLLGHRPLYPAAHLRSVRMAPSRACPVRAPGPAACNAAFVAVAERVVILHRAARDSNRLDQQNATRIAALATVRIRIHRGGCAATTARGRGYCSRMAP